MLKLKEYLNEEGVMIKVFARKIGFTPQYINLIFHRALIPSLEAAINIEKETKGKVSIYDWPNKPKRKSRKKSNKNKKDDTTESQPKIGVIFKP